jgi:hypothetical protein
MRKLIPLFLILAVVIATGCPYSEDDECSDDTCDIDAAPDDSTGDEATGDDDAPPPFTTGQEPSLRNGTHFGDYCGIGTGATNDGHDYGVCTGGMLCANGYPNASTTAATGLCIGCVTPAGLPWAGYAQPLGWCSTHYDSFGVPYTSRTNGYCNGGPYCTSCTPDNQNGHPKGPDGICGTPDDIIN